MTPEGKKRLGWGIGAIFALVVGYLLWSTIESNAQQAADAAARKARVPTIRDEIRQTGDIELDPNKLTLGRLNALLHETAVPQFNNGITHEWDASWWNGMVTAQFSPSANVLLDDAVPITLEVSVDPDINLRFLGSILGIHLGDPVTRVVAMGQRHGHQQEVGLDDIQLDEVWHAAWSSKNGRLTSFEIFKPDYDAIQEPE